MKSRLADGTRGRWDTRHWVSRGKTFLFKCFRLIIILGISYYILYPLVKKLSIALMPTADLYDNTIGLIPRHLTLENFKKVWETMKYGASFMNSLLLSLGVTVTQVISCTLVGYGFARFQFPCKKLLFALVILTLVVPPHTIIIPLYLTFRYMDVFYLKTLITGTPFNLLNSFWPFLLSGLTCMGYKNGLYVYLNRQYYRGVPKEIEEAALIDGAGAFKTFLFVMLPSSRPIMVVCAMFSFVWQWTDIFFSSWYMNSSFSLLSIQLSALKDNIWALNKTMELDQHFVSQLNAAGSLLVVLPILLLYVVAQKSFVEGFERSGVVG